MRGFRDQQSAGIGATLAGLNQAGAGVNLSNVNARPDLRNFDRPDLRNMNNQNPEPNANATGV